MANQVRDALVQLSQIANQPKCAGPQGWSAPNSRLLEDNLERVINYILNTAQGEYPLNGSGLKLYFSTSQCCHSQPPRLRMRMNVSGDQSSRYPEFVKQANAMLDELGLRPEH